MNKLNSSRINWPKRQSKFLDYTYQTTFFLKEIFFLFREIESSAALIESLTTSKQKGGKGMVDPLQKSLIQVKGQLQRAEERAQDLSEALNEAEEAAK